MAALHITVGTSDDLGCLRQCVKAHNTVVWPVPKDARVGDTILFLIPAFVGQLVASGTLRHAPGPSQKWAPKYEAVIGSIRIRDNPIPIEVLRQQLPKWKYLTYARGYTTVPQEQLAELEALLRVERRFDVETGVTPDEVEGLGPYWEGAVRQVTVNAYERNPEARLRCIKHYGALCYICGFDCAAIYGPIGEGLIHVHHLKPFSEIEEEYEVDPIADLRPVCPNCHAVIHRRNPPFSIEEIKAILND